MTSDQHTRPWRVEMFHSTVVIFDALKCEVVTIEERNDPNFVATAELIVAAVNAYRPTTEQAPGLVPVARTPDHRGIAFAYWASFEAGGDLRLAKLAIYHRQLALGIDDEMPAKETDDGRRKPPLPTPP